LLQCLVAAVRPLRVEELAEVLAVDFNAEAIPGLNPGWRWEDQEEAVMLACSSLVMIVKDDDLRIVQFSHFSVKEYLMADRLAEPIRDVSRYHIRLEAAHTILAQACLGVLLRLDDHVDRDNIKNFPLAEYAARYWATHARFENASSRIKDGMKHLFDADRPHFATWLWVYNEDNGTRNGRSMPTMCPEKPTAAPLYHAARLGFCDLVKLLIAEHPEHVKARGGNEVTPMHAAASGGHADILSLLLEHGADVDGRGIYNFTPLHHASLYGRLEAGKFLLDHGADINTRNDHGSTALSLAASDGYVEFAEMLLQRGAGVNDRDDYINSTPLHSAVRSQNVQVVQFFLDHGADVNARDDRGRTPYQLAKEWLKTYPRPSRQEIVDLLSDYGGKSESAE
jgi:ankyrin repeat protein